MGGDICNQQFQQGVHIYKIYIKFMQLNSKQIIQFKKNGRVFEQTFLPRKHTNGQ